MIKLRKSEIFLIIGLIIGITLVSFGISFINGQEKGSLFNYYKEDKITKIYITNHVESEDILSLFNELENEGAKISIENNINFSNIVFEANSEELNNKLYENLDFGKLVDNEVYITTSLKNKTYLNNGHEYIKYNNLDFKVKGYIDNKFSKHIIGNINNFFRKDFKWFDNSIYIIGTDIKMVKLSQIINANIEENKLMLLTMENNKSDNLRLFIEGNNKGIITLIICTLSISIFSLIWIEARRKEFSLYLVYGAKNIDVFKILIKEILKLSLIAIFISIIIQEIAYYIINLKGFVFYLDLTYMNIIVSLILALLISFIAIIPSYLEVMRIKPAVELKGGE